MMKAFFSEDLGRSFEYQLEFFVVLTGRRLNTVGHG
jgi:hypothetical protein